MKIQDLSINAVRVLGVDAVNKAKSGHPGMVLGAAPIMYTLMTKFIRATSKQSSWFNRDRFILSAGHASMLLYANLHFAGYKISMEDIQQFRQVNSKTPGHPEFGHTDGVDCTSGPLGQGLAHAVGFAIAEKHLAKRYNRPGFPIVDHYTYVLCSDGDLQEGLSQEAISLAGQLCLNKLIVVYDKNDVTLDGELHLTNSEDTQKRFESAQWNVEKVDGFSVIELELALHKAQLSDKPTLIIAQTVIGYGSMNQGTYKVHGAPLGEEDAQRVKQLLDWKWPPFVIPNEVYEHYYQTFGKRGNAAFKEWNYLLKKYEENYPKDAEEFYRALQGSYKNLTYPSYSIGHKEATRNTSNKVINSIANEVPTLIGGAADVAKSVNTTIQKSGIFTAKTPEGQNISYGIREFAMSCVQSGMLLHGGVRPFIGSFLVFVDYFKASIRTAALMNLPSINILTHDSIAVGEDGPTHQPIEQISTLRSIPNTVTIRPANALETTYAWRYAMENRQGPVNLILTRQDVIVNSLVSYEDFIQGAYIAKHEASTKYITLLATGSEVNLAFELSNVLTQKGIDHRIVSMPSTNLFNQLGKRTQLQLLGNPPQRIYALEMGSTDMWYRYANTVIGLDRFGLSGKGPEVISALGFSVDKIIATYFKKKQYY